MCTGVTSRHSLHFLLNTTKKGHLRPECESSFFPQPLSSTSERWHLLKHAVYLHKLFQSEHSAYCCEYLMLSCECRSRKYFFEASETLFTKLRQLNKNFGYRKCVQHFLYMKGPHPHQEMLLVESLYRVPYVISITVDINRCIP